MNRKRCRADGGCGYDLVTACTKHARIAENMRSFAIAATLTVQPDAAVPPPFGLAHMLDFLQNQLGEFVDMQDKRSPEINVSRTLSEAEVEFLAYIASVCAQRRDVWASAGITQLAWVAALFFLLVSFLYADDYNSIRTGTFAEFAYFKNKHLFDRCVVDLF